MIRIASGSHCRIRKQFIYLFGQALYAPKSVRINKISIKSRHIKVRRTKRRVLQGKFMRFFNKFKRFCTHFE